MWRFPTGSRWIRSRRRRDPGKIFEIVYESDAEAEVAFLIFVDGRGYLAGIDVTCGDSNHAPLPVGVRLGRVTYAGE
jgi:hypothetical protein